MQKLHVVQRISKSMKSIADCLHIQPIFSFSSTIKFSAVNTNLLTFGKMWFLCPEQHSINASNTIIKANLLPWIYILPMLSEIEIAMLSICLLHEQLTKQICTHLFYQCHVKWQCPSMIHQQKISKQLPDVSVWKLLHLECGMKSIHHYY